MADIQIFGHIANIRYQPECVLVFVDERRKGYRKSDGTRVDDSILQWKCIFSGNENKRTYIDRYFNIGSLVKVKGEVLPYALEHGQLTDGYSVLIQTINVAAYPSNSLKQEQRMQKESQLHSSGQPDLDAYNEQDF